MTTPITVLLIEDNPGDARLVKEELRAVHPHIRIQLENADLLESGLAYLAANRVDAVLVDLSLPDSAGLETVRRVVACVPQTPVIVMTGFEDEDTGLQALQAGAQDYLIKGQVDGRLLARVIQYGIQRKQAEIQLADVREFTERIITSSPVGIFTYRLSGECLSVNAAASQIVGGTIEQLQSQNFHQIESWKKSGLYSLATRTINTRKQVADDVHVLTTFGRDAWYRAQFVIFQSGGDDLLLMMLSDITEHKLTERALREREALLDKTQAISHVGSWELDLVNNLVTWSDEVHRIFGVGVTEFKGTYEAFLELVHPDDRSRVEDSFSESLRKRLFTFEIEHRIVQQTSGEIRCVHIKSEHLRDASGQIVRSVGMVQDITDRRKAEQALAASEKRFRTWIEHSSDIVTVVDAGGVIQYESPSIKRLLGFEPEELLGKSAFEMIHPDDQEKIVASFFENIQKPNASVGAEYRFLQKDGSWRLLEGLGHTYLDEHDEAVGLIHSRDITERKKTEVALRESEERYRLLFEHNPHPMWVYDLESLCFLAVNRAAVAHYGYSQEEFLAMTLREIRPAEDIPALESNLEIARDKYQFSGPWRHNKKDGNLILVEVTSHEVQWKDRPARLVLANDITERRKAEESLREKEFLLSEAQRIGHIGSWIYDIARDCLRFSDEMYHLLDVQPEEFHHRIEDFLALVYPSDRPMASNWFDAIKEGVQEKDLGFRLFHKTGELCYLHCTGTVEFDSTGAPSRFVGTLQDVTERRSAEMQINQQLKRLTALGEIDRAIISSVDQRYTLNVILSHMISQLGIDAADVLLLDADRKVLIYAIGQGFRTKMMEPAHVRFGESHAGRSAKEGRMIRIVDLRESRNDPEFNAVVLAEGFVSYVAMPLVVKGKVRGVLEVYQRSVLQPYPEWLDYFKTLVGQASIAIENTSLIEHLQTTNQELVQSYDATIEGWSRAMDLRDRETAGHSQRVAQLTLELARAMGIEESRLAHIRRGALLHDIGKLGVPDQILFKPAMLTIEERALIEKHVEFGYEMLAPIPYLKPALNIPYFHHEKWDGTGYPLGLKEEQIPLEARIFALVDVWDALLSERPHRPAWTREAVLEYIRTQSGTHFDPRVVEFFFEILQKKT